MHGVAMNCDVEMDWYDRFVPCGIADAGVTSLTLETGSDVPVAAVSPVLQRHLSAYLAWEPYDATPDYEPRPEPKHTPSIQLLTPAK
jgi:lipoyl(octanoyl) transferase